MNWLGWDTRSYLGALLGGVLGVFVYKACLDAGFAAPWMIGLGVGLGCAALTRERSNMRGLVLACLTAWTAALAEVTLARGLGLLEGIGAFHEGLGLRGVLEHVGGVVAAYLLGRIALRRDAEDRFAGQGRREFSQPAGR